MYPLKPFTVTNCSSSSQIPFSLVLYLARIFECQITTDTMLLYYTINTRFTSSAAILFEIDCRQTQWNFQTSIFRRRTLSRNQYLASYNIFIQWCATNNSSEHSWCNSAKWNDQTSSCNGKGCPYCIVASEFICSVYDPSQDIQTSFASEVWMAYQKKDWWNFKCKWPWSKFSCKSFELDLFRHWSDHYGFGHCSYLFRCCFW